jgi:hypothetical protein
VLYTKPEELLVNVMKTETVYRLFTLTFSCKLSVLNMGPGEWPHFGPQ